MTYTINTRNAAATGAAYAIARGIAFASGGAMRGRPVTADDAVTVGVLPSDWARTFQARRGVITYVITSYRTPVAWLDSESGWIIPAVKYSRTTSRHQNIARDAVVDYSE